MSSPTAKSTYAPPCTIVILGASGDLAQRKLLPALYDLDQCGDRMMPEQTAILGFARSKLGIDKFRQMVREGVEQHSRIGFSAECWDGFSSRLAYASAREATDGYAHLRKSIEATEADRGLP